MKSKGGPVTDIATLGIKVESGDIKTNYGDSALIPNDDLGFAAARSRLEGGVGEVFEPV